MFEFFRKWRQMPDFTHSANFFDVLYGIIGWSLVQVLGYGVRFLDLFGLGLNKKWKQGDKLQVLFLAYSGARNTGAEVRVAECIDQVNQVLGQDFVDVNMTTLNLEEAREYFKGNKVNLMPMSYIFFWDTFKFVLRNHLVVLVEGSCWKENFAAALLLFFLYGVGLAEKLGKPSFSYAVDAGEMNRFNNFISWNLSKGMTRYITRTSASRDMLEKIFLPGAIVRVDTAWTLRPNPVEWGIETLKKHGWDGKKPLVGLAMQNFFWWPVIPDFVRWIKGVHEYQYRIIYFYDYKDEDKKNYQNWATMLAGLLDWVVDKYGVQPVLIAMEALDDNSCQDVMGMMKHKPIIISCNDYVGVEIASILRNLTLLLTTRYHAMLLSMPGLVPFIGLSRDERIRGVMTETGLYDDYYADYSRDDLADLLREKVSQLIEREDEQERVKKIIRKWLPYYFAQMAHLGLDIRKIVKESFPELKIKDLDESDPEQLAPFIPPELREDVRQKFRELS
jgi:polysaccharide pyruvyl transferase WcaK-like protein